MWATASGPGRSSVWRSAVVRNRDQKTRDMARSILPSTGRRGAGQRKKGSARRARARNNARLRRLMGHVHDLDGFEEQLDRYDLDDDGWDGMVEDRRAADKVAPLIRWAEAHITRDPVLAGGDYWARRNHFAALLGDTVIGRHALGHLDHLFGEENPWCGWGYPGRPSWEEVRQRRRDDLRAEHDTRRRLLNDVLLGADARRLNARIEALTPPIEPHWRFDADGNRILARPSGYEPWLLDADPDAWLAVRGLCSTEAQEIAFQALAEVHAEMFPTVLQ